MLKNAFPNICALLALLTIASRAAGLPEPGLVAFGEVRGALAEVLASSPLRWTNRLGGEQVVVTSRWVVVNGSVFHIAQVPFETRQIPGVPPLEPTANTFELPAVPATFSRTAGLAGKALEFVDPAQASFSFGATDRGRVERVDLRVADAPPPVDSDGDGMPDADEILAGTDPHDPASVLRGYTELHPALVGGVFAGIAIEWQSVPGRSYVVERAGALGAPFAAVGPDVPAAAARTRFRDDTATGPGPFFYRIRVR